MTWDSFNAYLLIRVSATLWSDPVFLLEGLGITLVTAAQCIWLNQLHFPEFIEPIQEIQLLNATPDRLIFNWTRASTNCSSLLYIIEPSRDCGVCLNHTNLTQVMCYLSEYPTQELKICKLKVSIAVCGNLPDSRSNWKSITLTVKIKCKFNTLYRLSCFRLYMVFF